MDFSLSAEQQQIRDEVCKLCVKFDDAYWLEKDRTGDFPHELHAALAAAGWLGIAMPEAYGGAGLGITEAVIMMQAIAESGAAMSGASAVHINIFGLQPVVVFGTDEQKRRMLPPLIAGKDKACFAVTEPDAGLDTTAIKVRAERRGDHYLLSGQKIWISTAQVANKILILARTTPLDRVKRKTEGLSLFYTDLDRTRVAVRVIDKMGRHAVDSNEMFFDGMVIPQADRIGAEGDGFRSILHGMNPRATRASAWSFAGRSARIRRSRIRSRNAG
jgi:acyl-CoA dehydrogenase